MTTFTEHHDWQAFTPEMEARALRALTHKLRPGTRVQRDSFLCGLDGRIVGARAHVPDPYYGATYPIFYVLRGDDVIVGAGCEMDFDLVFLDRCPYCGPGQCYGSPRTADGHDIEAYYRHHPRERQPDREDFGPLEQCHMCLTLGTSHLFGLGYKARCPYCGSLSVHLHESER
jgi:hypothetical protein